RQRRLQRDRRPRPRSADVPQARPRRPREGRQSVVMKNFTYYRPDRIELAVTLLDDKWGRTELLAGGTDLHDLQKEYVAQPEKVVSLTGIADEGFGQITAAGDTVTIGAGVKLAEIAAHPAVRKACAALAAAAGQ